MAIKKLRRKLQFAGNSSYVLTLPKAWVKAVSLDNAHGEVLIEELADTSLRIIPSSDESHAHSSDDFVLNLKDVNSTDQLVRLILAAYLASKSKIIINSKGTIPAQYLEVIDNTKAKLWGSDIIEQTSDRIVIQDALNLTQFSIKEIIDRAWVTAKSMLTVVEQTVFSTNKADIESSISAVEFSENTLDKFYYLGLRQLYRAAIHLTFAQEIGISSADIIDYHLLLKNIERIGDHATQLVRHQSTNASLADTIEHVSKACEDAIHSFLKSDPIMAEEAIVAKETITTELEAIEADVSVPIVRSLLRLADYASDIGELTINRYVASLSHLSD